MIEAIKKLFPIRDEQGRPCTFPTFASQVFFDDGSVLEGKEFGGGTATVDPLTIYPVGSIYMTVSDTDPAMLFGGTWVKLENQFLLGAGSGYALGDTGGEATHNHGLVNAYATYAISTGSTTVLSETIWPGSSWTPNRSMTIAKAEMYEGNALNYATSVYGNTSNSTNLPPYLAVNMWKRIADEEVA